MGNDTWSNYGRQIYHLKRIRNIGIVFFACLLVFVTIFIIFRVKNGVSNETRELLNIWNEGDYESAYNVSKNLLQEKPVDFFFADSKRFFSVSNRYFANQ